MDKSQSLCCDNCGKILFKHPITGLPHNFCNRTCLGAYRSKNLCGSSSPLWRGGRTLHGAGYIRIRIGRGQPMTDCHGDILEHRYIMSQHLGRILSSNDIVHHLNGDRTDNRIENLFLYSSHSEHQKSHATKIIPKFCQCGRKHYARGMCINCYMRWHRRKQKLLSNPDNIPTPIG
jgi:hypothetical protein